MNQQVAFATVAHFALAAPESPDARLAVYSALESIAEGLRLPEETSTAAAAAEAIRNSAKAQMTFDELIRVHLAPEDKS